MLNSVSLGPLSLSELLLLGCAGELQMDSNVSYEYLNFSLNQKPDEKVFLYEWQLNTDFVFPLLKYSQYIKGQKM